MSDVAIKILLIFLALTAIGLGPSLLLIALKKRLQNSLIIAPVVGLILTTIFGSYFVLMDSPVSQWAKPWFVMGGFSSIIITAIMVRTKDFIFFKIDKKLICMYLVGFLVTVFLLMAPMVLGGLDFTVLRGNGTDTFNYVSLAGYLLHKSYSWPQHASMQALIDAHLSYGFVATRLLATRWSTSMLLAWCSQLVNVPLYKIEYGFTALFFMIAYNCAFIFSAMLKIRPRYILLISVAICVGFWAQIVLDMRAMSEITSLPLLLFIAFLVIKIDGGELEGNAWGAKVLLGLAMTAILFLYAEVFPTVLLALVIYTAIQFIKKKYHLKEIKSYCLAVIIFIVTMLPGKYVLKFLWSQMLSASSSKNTWWHSYFSWLYSFPIKGFFGLPGSLILNGQLSLRVLLYALEAMLLLSLFYAIIRALFLKGEKTNALEISVSFLFAAISQFFFLFSKGQLWAAGKGLSYGYPFVILATTIGGWIEQRGNNIFKIWLLKLVKCSVIVWLLLQCSFGVYRVIMVDLGKDAGYMESHSEYNHHDWHVASFEKIFKNKKIDYLGLDIKNNWVVEYLGFVFGWDMHVVDLYGVRNRDEGNKILGWQSLPKQFTYILISKDEPLVRKYKDKIVASNKELVLVEPTAQLTKDIIKKNMYQH